MTLIDTITPAIAKLPPEQVAQVRAWLNERAEAKWAAKKSSVMNAMANSMPWPSVR